MDQVVYYNPEEYLETLSGNKLHKRALIKGSDQIQLQGKVIMKSGLIIRGDLAKVTMGKYVTLMENVTLKPSYKRAKQKLAFIPITIGDYVTIESNSII
jgi:dynactin-5